MNIEILSASSAHVIELRKNLREGDRREILKLGSCLRRILWDTYNYTLEPKTIFVEGKLAAMFGCGGTVIGEVGHPWLLTTPLSEKYPLLFIRTYHEQVMKMLEAYPVLENMVDASYLKAIKLLEIIGFKVYDPEPVGPNQVMFRKFQMRASDA
jgi:hypothetical protein